MAAMIRIRIDVIIERWLPWGHRRRLLDELFALGLPVDSWEEIEAAILAARGGGIS